MCKIKGSIASLGLALISCSPPLTTGDYSLTQPLATLEESEKMARTAFPTGWTVLSGTLGTDIDTDTTTTLSGGVSLKWPSTASADAEVVSDWIPIPDRSVTGATTASNSIYSLGVWCRASSVAANKNVTIEIELADQNRTTITTDTFFDDPLTTVDSWEIVGRAETGLSDTDARWFRVKISRSTDIDFNLYVDRVELKELPSSNDAYRSAYTSFTGSWTDVVLNTEATSNYCDLDTGTGIVTIPLPGRYLITAEVRVNNIDTPSNILQAGDLFAMRIAVQRSSTYALQYAYGSTLAIPTGYPGNNASYYGDSFGMTASGVFLFNGTNNETGIGLVSAGLAKIQVVQHYSPGGTKDFYYAGMSVTRLTDR